MEHGPQGGGDQGRAPVPHQRGGDAPRAHFPRTLSRGAANGAFRGEARLYVWGCTQNRQVLQGLLDPGPGILVGGAAEQAPQFACWQQDICGDVTVV